MAKSYDRLFKSLAEDDPRGVLHVFGSLPLEAAAEVEPLDRELGLPVLAVDHLYRVRSGKREWLAHYEVQTHYETDVPARLCRYGASLALKFQLPIETVLVMLVERHAPASITNRHRMKLGAVTIETKFRVVRMWHLDGEAVAAAGRPKLLPWVTLMRHSADLLRRVAAEIMSLRDRELAAQFRLLGGLRYHRGEIADMLGGIGAMYSEAMIKESDFYQEILEEGLAKGQAEGLAKGEAEGLAKGEAKGEAKGLAKGRVEATRRLAAQVIAARFPELKVSVEQLAGLDADAVEALLGRILKTDDIETARREIDAARSSSIQEFV
ncbi:MAG: hypothetical protein ABI165_02975 [Bryobacteraceae bacterium]